MSNVDQEQQYKVHYIQGSSGRFIMTILYGLLVDPLYVNYSNNSAHEFQSKYPGSFLYYIDSKYRKGHSLPKEYIASIKYIIIAIKPENIKEISLNHFQKNVIENMINNGSRSHMNKADLEKYVAKELIDQYSHWPWDNFANIEQQVFDELYQKAVGHKWVKSSIDLLSIDERSRMEDIIYHWMLHDPNCWDFVNYTSSSTNRLVINYDDIFQPTSSSSWRVLDQLIDYAQVSHVDPQVRDNYRRYVDQRNNRMGTR